MRLCVRTCAAHSLTWLRMVRATISPASGCSRMLHFCVFKGYLFTARMHVTRIAWCGLLPTLAAVAQHCPALPFTWVAVAQYCPTLHLRWWVPARSPRFSLWASTAHRQPTGGCHFGAIGAAATHRLCLVACHFGRLRANLVVVGGCLRRERGTKVAL